MNNLKIIMALSHTKRQRIDISDSDSSDTESWPRYITITGEGLSKLSSIAIMKGIQGMAGSPKDVTRQRNGQLLVEVEKKSHSSNLLRTTQLAGVEVQCTPHKTLNSCKGVVRSYESVHCTEEELLEWLKPQGVTAVKQIISRRGPIPSPTPVLFLTFDGSKLPKSVTVGFEHCRVDPFIPNPMRCFKCQAYGHHSDSCKKQQVCACCGSSDHMHSRQTPCGETPNCVNCKGNHSAFSRDCPVWKKEKEIQTLKVTKGISYPEARKLVNQPTVSYAAVAAKPVCKQDAGTQTSYTWLGEQPTIVTPATSKTVPPPTKPIQPVTKDQHTNTTEPSIHNNNTATTSSASSGLKARDNSHVGQRSRIATSGDNSSSEEEMESEVPTRVSPAPTKGANSKAVLDRSKFKHK